MYLLEIYKDKTIFFYEIDTDDYNKIEVQSFQLFLARCSYSFFKDYINGNYEISSYYKKCIDSYDLICTNNNIILSLLEYFEVKLSSEYEKLKYKEYNLNDSNSEFFKLLIEKYLNSVQEESKTLLSSIFLKALKE